MKGYNHNEQSGDLTKAIDKARKHRVKGRNAGRIALGVTACLSLIGGGVLAANHAAEQKQLAPPEEYVAGRVVVKLHEEIKISLQDDGNVVTGIDEIDALNEELSGETYEQLAEDSDEYDLDEFYIIDVPLETDLEELIKDFSRIDEVEYVQYDPLLSIPEIYEAEQGEACMTALGESVPNDKLFNSSGSWGQDFEDQWGPHRLGAKEAWEFVTGMPTTIFAVLDTGIDHNHPDIGAKMWTDKDGYHGYNFVHGNTDTMDRYGHGTAIAGIIAADTNNEIGIAGLNWEGQLMAVKVCGNSASGKDGCPLTAIIRGIIYAANNGAHVINMSFGGPDGPWSLPGNLALTYAFYKGVISVNAAGNSNEDAAKDWPSNNPYTLAVAAIDHEGKRAYFPGWWGSNWGDTVDVAAPGVEVLSTISHENKVSDPPVPIIDKIYAAWGGTSLSSPHVAAEVGLIYAANPKLIGNYGAVRRIVRAAVRPYDSDKYIGTGIIDYALAVMLAMDTDTDDSDSVPPHLERIEYLRENITQDPHFLNYWPSYFQRGAMMHRGNLIVGSVRSEGYTGEVIAAFDQPFTNDGTIDAVVVGIQTDEAIRICTLMKEDLSPVQDTFNEHYRIATDAWYRALTEGNDEIRTVVGEREYLQLVEMCEGRWQSFSPDKDMFDILYNINE